MGRAHRQPSPDLLGLLLDNCRRLKSVRLTMQRSLGHVSPWQLARLVQRSAASLEELDVSGAYCLTEPAFTTLMGALATCPRLQRLNARALCDFVPKPKSNGPTIDPDAIRPIGALALAALEAVLGGCTSLRELTLPFLTMPATGRLLRKLPQLAQLAHLGTPLCPAHLFASARASPLFAHPSLSGLQSLCLELYNLSHDYAGALNALGSELARLPALESLNLSLSTNGDRPGLAGPLTAWSLPRLVALTLSISISPYGVPDDAPLPAISAPQLELLQTTGVAEPVLLGCLGEALLAKLRRKKKKGVPSYCVYFALSSKRSPRLRVYRCGLTAF